VSTNRLSLTRQDIEFVYGTTGSILTPAYLQDSNESLTSYTRARYEGAKVSSLLYSVYTSASADYSGDSSYGKTAAINKDTRKIGLFTDIVASSLLPGRNKVALKYLVDEFGDLTELNQRNKNWEDVQRTFIAGDYLNVSQFDNQKSSNQKSTDGNKLIFDSGYSYNPILYFASCSSDSKIYFENLSGASSYRATAKNLSSSYYVSGSSPLGFPVVGGVVKNIFNYEVEDLSRVFSPGNLSSFPSYSVSETGEYTIQATFDMTMTLPDNQSASWSLQVYRSSSVISETLLFESENVFSDVSPITAYRILYAIGATEGGPCSRTEANAGSGWAADEYLVGGDTIFTNSSLTTPLSYTGYFAQYVPGIPDPVKWGAVYPITSGVLQNNSLVIQC
jgi:hypothetical protein